MTLILYGKYYDRKNHRNGVEPCALLVNTRHSIWIYKYMSIGHPVVMPTYISTLQNRRENEVSICGICENKENTKERNLRNKFVPAKLPLDLFMTIVPDASFMVVNVVAMVVAGLMVVVVRFVAMLCVAIPFEMPPVATFFRILILGLVSTILTVAVVIVVIG